MSSLVITTRRTNSGPRYVVRYRLGGRAYPIIHAGSFKTLKEGSCPEHRLFPGLNEGTMRDALARASRAAGLPLCSPHDLRHRRGSLWHASGMSARELAEQMGHSKPSMSLDVYMHVMAPDEVPAERFLDLLTRQAKEVTRP